MTRGLLVLWATCCGTALWATNHEFAEPEDRPRVVRYACCETVDIFNGASLNARVIGRLNREELVYVFNLLGQGLPASLAGCSGTPAPCGTTWAEIYATEQRIEGFVPLNALFVRDLIPTEDRLQYEIGFERLYTGIADALQDQVIAPPNCGDASNTNMFRGSDLPGDWIMSPDRTMRRTCDSLVAIPAYRLLSCADLDEDSDAFDACRFRTSAECEAGGQPRAPSRSLSFCEKTFEPRRAQCRICRDWYALTGQDASGWKTNGELVDGCLAQISDPLTCLPPSGGGGGGGGTPGETPAAGDGFAQSGEDGEWDPNDVPGAPEPLVVEPDGPQSLAAAGGAQAGQSNCVGLCQERLQTWRASSCRNYIGAADRKLLADHEDYACGELPFGKTHPLYFLNMDTGQMSGAPDPDWKWLQSVPFGAGESLIVQMGRANRQTGYVGRINDLTRAAANWRVNVRERLGQQNFWFRLKPVRGARLELEACLFLPGVTLDTVPVRPDTTSQLGLWVEEIDLGRVAFDRVELCQGYTVSATDAYALRVRPYRFGDLTLDIAPGSLEGVDITYTALTNGATVAAPVANILLTAFQIKTEIAEALSSSAAAEKIAQLLVIVYENDIRTKLVNTLQDAIDAGIDDLNAAIDAPDLLGRMCGALAPEVRPSDPSFWFNTFLRWQCDGFAAEPDLRAFLSHSESEGQGCYREDWFINPQDARRAQWWTPYTGQSWAYNLVNTSDQGCRVVGDIGTRLDRDTWPTMICAMAMQNTWFNGTAFPRERALQRAIQNNCAGFVRQSMTRYYGDGSDLQDLFIRVNQPSTPAGGIGEIRLE
ncbi:hypothetical protein [Primorskyibacter sp. S187A]|uniref:hypothetical protein n=1 Tax=Primorskyibacter sp. S187A TaxID=3415130 RepID=UPI003C79F4B9